MSLVQPSTSRISFRLCQDSSTKRNDCWACLSE